MTSTTASAEEILGGLYLDSDWHNLPLQIQNATRQNLQFIPIKLSWLLTEPANLKNILIAQRMLMEIFPSNCPEEIDAMLMRIDEGLISDQEERRLLVEYVGICEIALGLCDLDRLTIADLLKIQPGILINFCQKEKK